MNWKYRPDGWSIKQVVHHCADSHMNSFIRFKLALTEERPKIKPYFEGKWAELPDGSLDDSKPFNKLNSGFAQQMGFLTKSVESRTIAKRI